MRRFLYLSLLLIPASAQTVQFGAIGGVTATNPDPFGNGESKRYWVGPSVEARFLNGKIGVELDAIYRRFGYSYAGKFGPVPPDYQGPSPITTFYVRARGNSWELPLIGKYYFRTQAANWRPFLGTGYSLNMQWWHTDSTTYRENGSAENGRYSSRTDLNIGATAVAGIELKTSHHLKFQPQIRYTRWANHGTQSRSLNQVDVGLSFRF